jgi:homoserine dehydrogenase
MTPPEAIKIAMLGLGNVGRAFARYVAGQQPGFSRRILVAGAADSTGGLLLTSSQEIDSLLDVKAGGSNILRFGRDRAISVKIWIDLLAVLGVSVLVESLPTNLDGGQPALGLIELALRSGINVVTVDKAPVVHGWQALSEAAAAGHSRVEYSGTTGVRPPHELQGSRVLEIRGILNGTTNYLLTEMQEKGVPFQEALIHTQRAGVAEPDPTFDTHGWDTACKILILARSLMGADATLSDVSRIGIGPETESLIEVARSSGRRVRLIGRARIWQGRVRVSVAPKLVGPDSPFFAVEGTSKAALFRTDGKGEVVVHGTSGRDAISQTILEDIERIVSHTTSI